jgi:hypothetical protein
MEKFRKKIKFLLIFFFFFFYFEMLILTIQLTFKFKCWLYVLKIITFEVYLIHNIIFVILCFMKMFSQIHSLILGLIYLVLSVWLISCPWFNLYIIKIKMLTDGSTNSSFISDFLFWDTLEWILILVSLQHKIIYFYFRIWVISKELVILGLRIIDNIIIYIFRNKETLGEFIILKIVIFIYSRGKLSILRGNSSIYILTVGLNFICTVAGCLPN